jgi:hypothetical protein
VLIDAARFIRNTSNEPLEVVGNRGRRKQWRSSRVSYRTKELQPERREMIPVVVTVTGLLEIVVGGFWLEITVGDLDREPVFPELISQVVMIVATLPLKRSVELRDRNPVTHLM